MLSDKMQAALNDQLNAEAYSAYLYWSMSACFEAANLKGFASWMRAQALEEMVHAAKFFDFVNQRRGRVILGQIKAPPTEWASPLEAFEAAFKHECYVTSRIHDLVALAAAEKDHATASFLRWFVDEQVEEEATADEIVQKLRQIADSPGGLFMLDRELAARKFSPPAGGEGGD